MTTTHTTTTVREQKCSCGASSFVVPSWVALSSVRCWRCPEPEKQVAHLRLIVGGRDSGQDAS
jgi:hypothetical protein